MKPYYSTNLGSLFNTDCLTFMQTLEDKSIDLVLTDPPYGINYQSNMRTQTAKFEYIQNDNNDSRFVAYREYFRILKDDCAALIFCSFKNYADDYNELKKYFDIKNVIVWWKMGGGIGDLSHSLLTDYELCIVAHKGNAIIRGKRDGSVWQILKVNPSGMVHPTEKPIDLMTRLIKKYSDENSVILDSYCGSGTTAVACEQLGRRWIGCEISEKYCEIAAQRIKREADQIKMF